MTERYRIEGLALHEIGPFNDLRLNFLPIASQERDERKAEIHLFTGPNGCGKSTLLYALAGIFDAQSSASLIGKRFRGASSKVEYVIAGRESGYGNSPPDQPAIPSFAGLRQRSITLVSLLPGFQTISPAFSYSGQRTIQNVPIHSIQPLSISPFENALSFGSNSRPELFQQWIANNRAQAALAQADGNTAEAKLYDKALRRISNLIKDICELDVEFRLERSPLAVSLRVDGKTTQFDVLPDGLKSIISWIGDLSLRLEAVPWSKPKDDVFLQPIILLLDEIDIHLHPRWQRRILPAVQKLLPNAQIFVSTHSPFVVGSVEDAWVYRLPEPGKTSGPITVEGVPSSAGKSYRLILEDVFGIGEEFDVETEELFTDFYAARASFLKSPVDPAQLQTIARELSERGEECAQIVARELRQISRISGQEIEIA